MTDSFLPFCQRCKDTSYPLFELGKAVLCQVCWDDLGMKRPDKTHWSRLHVISGSATVASILPSEWREDDE